MRLLYLDRPFAGQKGGDKARSRFLWDALARDNTLDTVLLSETTVPAEVLGAHAKHGSVHGLRVVRGRLPSPRTTWAPAPGSARQLTALLGERAYDAIVVRFTAPAPLALLAPPRMPVVVDVDMLQSRLAEMSWKQNRSVRNRFYLFESILLRHFEQRLFSRPWLFLFSNDIELQSVARRHRSPAAFELLPNTAPPAPVHPPARADGACVLFFGALDSSANIDAFRFLATELYPRLEPALKRHGITCRVVGRGQTPLYADLASRAPRIRVDGEVEDLAGAIAGARLCLLPLRIASGTRTRILEAGIYSAPVVTTTVGAEGLDLGPEHIVRADTAEALAAETIRLLDDRPAAERMGGLLRERVLARYSADSVAAQLRALLAGRTQPSGPAR